MIKRIWGKIRNSIDRLLEYDPNPPVVIEKDDLRIIVHDGLPPEANAMAMAMYSRDPRSFLVHLREVLKKGWQKFMAQFYAGYGHKSIGDCGTTNLCAENVSMLNAKAVQYNELYNGQEASTRYLDMAKQKVLNPHGTETGKDMQERSMGFYSRILEALVPYLKEMYPRLETDDPKIYEKAIKARAFDIARAFLPAGCTTYVGWHTTLRQALDHLSDIRFHVLAEVRQMAYMMLAGLREKYPSSFTVKNRPEQERYHLAVMNALYFTDHAWPEFFCENRLNVEMLRRNQKDLNLLIDRPKWSELPDWFKRYGQVVFRFLLDFGSYRDAQRQRSATQIMPLLTLDYGFHPWYLESLPPQLKHEAIEHLLWLEMRIRMIENPYLRQYYIPMGYRVTCELTCGLPSAVYIAELRSGQAVHPTLRPVAQDMGRALVEILPEMALHCDMSPDEWSTVRGKHDIVKKV